METLKIWLPIHAQNFLKTFETWCFFSCHRWYWLRRKKPTQKWTSTTRLFVYSPNLETVIVPRSPRVPNLKPSAIAPGVVAASETKHQSSFMAKWIESAFSLERKREGGARSTDVPYRTVPYCTRSTLDGTWCFHIKNDRDLAVLVSVLFMHGGPSAVNKFGCGKRAGWGPLRHTHTTANPLSTNPSWCMTGM